MTLSLLPDAEKVVSKFLLAQSELTALVQNRVYSVLPANATYPAVRVTRWGGTPTSSYPLYVDRPTLQIDVFGGPKRTCQQVAETIRQLLAMRLTGTATEGVVSRVEFGVLADQPDTTFNPPKPRIRFDITLTTHP